LSFQLTMNGYWTCRLCWWYWPPSLFTCLWSWVSLVEQKIFILLNHLSLSPVFSRVHVTRSLIFSVVFCRSLFFLLSFSFWSFCQFFPIYRLWLLLGIFKLFLSDMVHACIFSCRNTLILKQISQSGACDLIRCKILISS